MSIKQVFDIVIIGSGAGGATVANALSKIGKKVVLLEKGRDHRWIGNIMAAAMFIDRLGFRRSQEGLCIIRAITTGGSTMIYGANSVPPPDWFLTEYGINLEKYTASALQDLKPVILPDHLIGPGVSRIMNAANELGFDWNIFPKFVNPLKCVPNCSDCTVGCKRGAKWTARSFIDTAISSGCKLYTKFTADTIIIENRTAIGVTGFFKKKPVKIYGKIIIVAAGGLGTPVILRRSGLHQAGRNFFCDPMAFVYGVIKGRGISKDIPNTAGTMKFHESDGLFFADSIDPMFSFPLQLLLKGIRHLPKWRHYHRTLGILVKIKDDPGGCINPDGTFSKPLTKNDLDRLEYGVQLAKQVLYKAGAPGSSIYTTPIRGAHPGGTAAIGKVVNPDLATEIKNLFVADASVMPKPLAAPQTLTIVALAKRLAEQIGQPQRVP